MVSSSEFCSDSNSVYLIITYLGLLFFSMTADPCSSTSRATLEKFWFASVIDTRFFVLIFMIIPTNKIIPLFRINLTYFRKLDIRAIVVFCFAYFEEVFILIKKEAVFSFFDYFY